MEWTEQTHPSISIGTEPLALTTPDKASREEFAREQYNEKHHANKFDEASNVDFLNGRWIRLEGSDFLAASHLLVVLLLLLKPCLVQRLLLNSVFLVALTKMSISSALDGWKNQRRTQGMAGLQFCC